jgi:hypothetical protein
MFLPSADVSLLIEAIDRMMEGMRSSHSGTGKPVRTEALQAHLAELNELRAALLRPSGPLADPLKLDQAQERLLRAVLADITGYQRADLTPSLKELRQLLSNA